VIEVHLENIFLPDSKIEKPIQIPEIEIGLISGLGLQGYGLAIQSLASKLKT
jgi:3-dehydroquinate dehydratase